MNRKSLVRWLGIVAVVMCSSPAYAGKIVFKNTTTIVSEVPKPEVNVFITRQNLNKAYDLVLKESFLNKITDAVEHPPF